MSWFSATAGYPVFDPDDPQVTAGPYAFSDYEAGEFYEITANPDFYYYPPPSKTTSTTTTTTTTNPTGSGFNASLALVAGAVGAAVVILVGGFVLLKQR
ncbi:MAG: hypothetical protein ACTSV3_06380 [Candidatus Thorarchaeota archaeon]